MFTMIPNKKQKQFLAPIDQSALKHEAPTYQDSLSQKHVTPLKFGDGSR